MGLGAFLLLVLTGVFLGIITGMTPGVHVNTVALLALYAYQNGFDGRSLAIVIVANMITHTFVDFIPSTFLGAPSEDTALSTLPMHRMLLQRRGYQAVYLSTYGSALAVILSLPLLPVLFLFLSKFYTQIRYWIPVALLAIILGMLLMESRKGLRSVLLSLLLFLLSGILGFILFHLPNNWNYAPLGFASSFLFPAFSGLFGIPVLLLSRDEPIPEQRISRGVLPEGAFISSLLGTLAGALVGLLPGVSSGVATVLSKMASKKEDIESFIVSLGSVNTANYIFNILALFVILKPRSGALEAVGSMVNVNLWYTINNPPALFLLFLIVVILAGIISFPVTLILGRVFASLAPRFSRKYRRLSYAIILFILLLVFLFTGPLGIIVALAGTFIGLLPPRFGVMRVHMMSVIILPVLLLYI